MTVTNASQALLLSSIAPLTAKEVITVKGIGHLFRSKTDTLSIVGVGGIGRDTGKVILVLALGVAKFAVVTGLGEVGSGTVDIKVVVVGHATRETVRHTC